MADVISMEKEKGLDESHGHVNLAFCVVSGQREVGCCVREVDKGASDELGSFDDARAKVFIRRKHSKVVRVKDFCKKACLIW
jgi:hypothetical protein